MSKNSRFLNYFVSWRWVGLFSLFEKTHVFPTILPTTSWPYIFVFGNTHVFLTIRFPTVARTFFFGRKNSRFFNYFPNDLSIQFCVWKNSRFFNYFVSRLWLLLFSVVEKTHVFPTILPTTSWPYIFVFGNTHVFLTIRFPTVARTFFFGRKNSRFFNYFPNDLSIQFCVWKNSRFFNYFVSRLWLLLFSVVEKTHVFSTIFYQRPYTKVLCLEKLTFFSLFRFPSVFFGTKNSRFLNYCTNVQFCVWKNSRFF